MDKAKLIAEIIANSGPPLRQPDDIAWEELAEEWEKKRGDRMTIHRAQKMLNDEVFAGTMKTEMRYDPVTARMRRVWWPLDKK